MQPQEFLLLAQFDWPQPKLQDDAVTQPVFKTTVKERTTTLKVDSAILHTNATVKEENISTSAKREPINEVLRFFDSHRLLRTTARVVQLKGILQQKQKRHLRIDDRETAKNSSLREQSQNATFPDTIKCLTTNKALDNKAASLPCSPFIHGNLNRARGRLRHSTMPDATKYPIFLHAKEPSIQFMIKNAHHKSMHLGREFLRHNLQQRFVILGLSKT